MAENAEEMARGPEFGIVVIGRNEGQRLVKCLNSLGGATKWLVYVDSGSTDGSVNAAREASAHIVELDAARPFTAARARNEGARLLFALRPDIGFVQFIDGDCEMSAGWLQKAREFVARREDVAIVCGRRRERHVSASVYNRLCDLEWDTPIGQALWCGGDSFVRAKAFHDVGGFNDALIAGEEPEMCLRLREKGWKIWRLDAEMTLHDAAMTRFRQWWLRCARGGYAMAEVAAMHWSEPDAIWKRELLRALIWGLLAPVCILAAASGFPLALAGLLIYPLQIVRIALAREPAGANSWIYASFVTLAKFSEMQGAATYFWRVLLRRRGRLIEYK
jgi:GT2 family glycosyltransferase